MSDRALLRSSLLAIGIIAALPSLAAAQHAPEHTALVTSLKKSEAKMTKLISSGLMSAVSADGKVVLVGDRKRVRIAKLNGAKQPIERVLYKPPKPKDVLGFQGLDLSSDGRFAVFRDDYTTMRVFDVNAGKLLLTAPHVHKTLITPSHELLWWAEMTAVQRLHAQVIQSSAMWGDAPAPSTPEACVIRRAKLDKLDQATTIKLKDCQDILHVAADGSFAVVGSGRTTQTYHSLEGYGGTPFDAFAKIERVDLSSGARRRLGGEGLVRVSVSADGETICGVLPDEFNRAERSAGSLRCDRGGAQITVSAPAPEGTVAGWLQHSVSPDGRWLLVSVASPLKDHRDGFYNSSSTHVIPVRAGAKPLISVPGWIGGQTWLNGEGRLFFSVARAHDFSAFLFEGGQGRYARLDTPGRIDQQLNAIPIGASSPSFLLSRGRHQRHGADVWRVDP